MEMHSLQWQRWDGDGHGLGGVWGHYSIIWFKHNLIVFMRCVKMRMSE